MVNSDHRSPTSHVAMKCQGLSDLCMRSEARHEPLSIDRRRIDSDNSITVPSNHSSKEPFEDSRVEPFQ